MINQNVRPILLALLMPFGFILLLFLSQVFGGLFTGYSRHLAYGILGSIFAFLLTWGVVKVDKKTLGDFGLVWEKGTIYRFGKGYAIGLILALVMLGTVIVFSDLSVSYNKESSWLVSILLMGMFLPLGWMEEVAMRGYPFLQLNKILGLRVTQVIMAIIFAYYHDFSGQTFHMQLLGPGIWAFVYGLAAVWSDGIALPTGIHVAVNMVLSFFGTKDGYPSILTLDYKSEVTEAMTQHTQTIGTALQIVLLVGALIAMEWYIRSGKMKQNNYYKQR